MSRAEFTNWAVDEAGNVVASAAFEVRWRSNASLVTTVYDAASGVGTVSNPGTATSGGLVNFWLPYGEYEVTIGSGASAVTIPFDAAPATGVPRSFASRAAAVTEWAAMVARSETPPVGTLWTFDGVSIEYDGTSDYITSLSGWAYNGGILSSDLTVNVPTDYATWQDAIEALSCLKVKNGVTITVNLESGTAIESGMLLENGDYRHFILTADDATTYLDAGFTGVTISGAPTESSNAVIALYRAHGPTLSCLIDMNGANGAGLFITTNSMMEVSPSCGIINALRYGVSVSSTSTLNADNSNFSGAGWGNRVTTSSNASLRKANLSGGVDQDAEAACLVISRGSFVDLRGDPLDMTDLSGATYNGIYCRRSFLSADWVDVSGAGAYGVRASHGSHVSFYGGNADGCSIGIGSLESWVNAKNATAIGCTDRAVYAEDGGYVNAYGVDGSGSTGTYGARASDGSEINIVNGNMTKAVSDTNDISVKGASTIRAFGSSGQLSQTANVIGTNGVIIK